MLIIAIKPNNFKLSRLNRSQSDTRLICSFDKNDKNIGLHFPKRRQLMPWVAILMQDLMSHTHTLTHTHTHTPTHHPHTQTHFLLFYWLTLSIERCGHSHTLSNTLIHIHPQTPTHTHTHSHPHTHNTLLLSTNKILIVTFPFLYQPQID